MLIEFRVENHRSIRDEQVFSMEAGRGGSPDDARPRSVAGCSSALLPVAAIFGANASGKSNVLEALAYMTDAVRWSYRLWAPDEGILRDPFAWGPARDEPSLYEVEIVVEGVRYRYGFILDDQVILEEWLYAWPNGKKQVWFERERQTFRFGENLKGENQVIEGLTRPNSLFLSAAAQLQHAQLSRLFSWFGSIEVVNLPLVRRHRWYPMTVGHRLEREFNDLREGSGTDRTQGLSENDWPDSMLDSFKSLLKAADIGIVDVRLGRSGLGPGGHPSRFGRFELKHESDTENAWLPLDEESRGTQTLFRLALPILHSIRLGTLLVVDELESSIHPNLAGLIVSQYNDPSINRRNAQLIFSTHDTNLIGTLVGESVLRRDQIWLTEKDPKGATVLYPLTDFKPRKDENLARGYLQGRYGAIPFLGGFRVPSEAVP